jgi:hypothetical protein
MGRPAADATSEDPRSFASRDGFTKLSLVCQAGREAAEAVSADLRSSDYQDTFEKALSVSLKDGVLRTDAALLQGRVEEFQ